MRTKKWLGCRHAAGSCGRSSADHPPRTTGHQPALFPEKQDTLFTVGVIVKTSGCCIVTLPCDEQPVPHVGVTV